ncbi:T9SS type A sorting domain-containing protein [candidate division KSB1 bacterium]|nr:T9SS type A sorting domain-containing protein [candidate division KSB1 bacterium]
MKFLCLISIIILIIASFVLAYTNLTPEEVHFRLVRTDTLILLDVREVNEYNNGHIAEPIGQLPLTPVNMPLNSNVLPLEYSRLPRDIDIIVYCRSGGRSSSAASFLESKGFTRIFNMLGGFSSWTFESRGEGFGDHSGRWIHKTDGQPTTITYPLGIDTSKISFFPTALPETDDSIYVELHFASPIVHNPPNIPPSELKGLYRLTVLDRFGLSMFIADSLLLSDTINIVLFPQYKSDKNTLIFSSQNMTVYVPGEGWRTISHKFQDYSFHREEVILRRWYNTAVFLSTNVRSKFLDKRQEIQIFPNPFNSVIQILAPDDASINIYDIRGRLIEKLKNGPWIPNSTLCSGIYYIKIKYSDKVIITKVTYLK